MTLHPLYLFHTAALAALLAGIALPSPAQTSAPQNSLDTLSLLDTLKRPPSPQPQPAIKTETRPHTMPYELAPLPYANNALEPAIDAQTMEIHHDKHHTAYVANLNNAVKDQPALAGKSVEALLGDLAAVPEAVRTAVRNNAGGHWNHTFFWNIMAAPGHGGGGKPSGTLATAIDAAFGSLEAFQEKFQAAGAGRFGSGWVWLLVKADKTLALASTPNQDNPLMVGIVEPLGRPILGADVWEHAYYLRYQNRRPDYLKAWWSVVNWKAVEALYAAAVK